MRYLKKEGTLVNMTRCEVLAMFDKRINAPKVRPGFRPFRRLGQTGKSLPRLDNKSGIMPSVESWVNLNCFECLKQATWISPEIRNNSPSTNLKYLLLLLLSFASLREPTRLKFGWSQKRLEPCMLGSIHSPEILSEAL